MILRQNETNKTINKLVDWNCYNLMYQSGSSQEYRAQPNGSTEGIYFRELVTEMQRELLKAKKLMKLGKQEAIASLVEGQKEEVV